MNFNRMRGRANQPGVAWLHQNDDVDKVNRKTVDRNAHKHTHKFIYNVWECSKMAKISLYSLVAVYVCIWAPHCGCVCVCWCVCVSVDVYENWIR